MNSSIAVKVSEIEWEADDMNDILDINTSMTIQFPLHLLEFEDKCDFYEIIEDYVSNIISDISGFTHTGFNISYHF